MVPPSADDIVRPVLNLYSSTGFRPPLNQFTILAAFILSNKTGVIKVISLGTGSKCLPGIRLRNGGDALHDSHAEVVARRGAVRWFLEEIERVKATGGSIWMGETSSGLFGLLPGVRLHFYVSTVPCKRPLYSASRVVRDRVLTTTYRRRCVDAISRDLPRCRDGCAQRLERRANSAAERCGERQRQLLPVRCVTHEARTRRFAPDPVDVLQRQNRELECSRRAGRACLAIPSSRVRRQFCHRRCPGWHASCRPARLRKGFLPKTGWIGWSVQYVLRDTLVLTLFQQRDCLKLSVCIDQRLPLLPYPSSILARSFAHRPRAMSVRDSILWNDFCADSKQIAALCWIADYAKPYEVLINGLRRGVPPKHRQNPKFRSFVSLFAVNNGSPDKLLQATT